MSNYGRDGLTDFEYLLDKDALYEHIEKEAQDLWPVRKGRGTTCNDAEAMELLIRGRPALYERYRTLVQRDKGPVTQSRQAAAVVKGLTDGRSALATLEAMAHDHVSKGVVDSYPDGLERAIRERPDLYEAYARSVQVQKVVR